MGKEQNKETEKQTQEPNEPTKLIEVRFGKEKVENWKKHFAPRQLIIIEVEDRICVLSPVTASALSQYCMIVRTSGLDDGARYLLSELWLDGDEEIRNDEDYFIGAMMQLQNGIELKKSKCWKF